MKISDRGLNFIRTWEGVKLEAYKCSANVLTIGAGHTKGVKPGMKISMQQAEEFLRQDLVEVEKAIAQLVKVPLNQNQYDSICSFTFNLGVGALQKSTLLKLLNQGNYKGAADEFIKWCHADGKIVEGLMRRRKAEKTMFLKQDS